MTKKRSKKPAPEVTVVESHVFPMRSDLREYVYKNLFTEDEWELYLNLTDSDDDWQVGVEAWSRILRRFELPPDIFTNEMQRYLVRRLQDETKDVTRLSRLKQKVFSNIWFMLISLKP